MRDSWLPSTPFTTVILSEAKDPGEIATERDASRNTEAAESYLSPQTLARLWPNRVHESNWLKNLACRFGLHRWHDMKFEDSKAAQVVRFCRWCSKIKTLGNQAKGEL